MDKVLEIGKWILANYQAIIASIVGLCMALIVIAQMIPGEQPEKFLQGVVDFLAKFSAKKEDPK